MLNLLYSINIDMYIYSRSANVQWTFYVHWIQWTIACWTLPITNISMIPFPGGHKVRFSPLDPIDSQISNRTFDISIPVFSCEKALNIKQ